MARRSIHCQFTDKAERDLEGIIDYTVQEWAVSQANTYLDGLESRAQLLAENPDLGITREILSEGRGATQFPLRESYSVLQKTRPWHRNSTSTPSANESSEASLILQSANLPGGNTSPDTSLRRN